MNKASRGDGIPVELFQILKEDAMKMLHNMPANLENSAVATGLEKVTFHFPALKKEMATHSSIPAWRIPSTAEPGGLPSMGSHRVGHD